MTEVELPDGTLKVTDVDGGAEGVVELLRDFRVEVKSESRLVRKHSETTE